MRDLRNNLKNKEVNYKKLLLYGFNKENDKYIYKTRIFDDKFEMIVIFSENESKSELIDIESEEEYILVDIDETVGEFVGKVREEYDRKLEEILNKCTDTSIFKASQSKEIINYIKKKYGDDLEFLWEKFDNNAIWRNKQNNKWYGVILTLQANKLGINSEEVIEILDLRYQKGENIKIIDNIKIFHGYHMNKQSWITIKLDNSISTKEICELIENSYNLSIGNKTGISGNELFQKVFDYLTTIPKGKVVTYKQVAEHVGNKGLARVVGNILHQNPDGDKYPCYKVLNCKGELAEAFVFGGKDVQKERLENDGIKVIDNKVDLKVYQWNEG